MIADLDTLLIARYVELTDRIIPTLRPRRGPGRPPTVTDAEVVCLAVAQVLLRYNDEHHWLRAAPARVGHLFPRLLSQPEYNRRLRRSADLLEVTLRWLAERTPATTERLRLTDGVEASLAAERLHPVRPTRRDEPAPGTFPAWLRQRVEATIWTLKHQLGLDRHGGRVPSGLWARVVQRLLALNAAIWFNWQISAPVKRSRVAYDH